MTLHFGLPDLDTRKKVLKRYAKHLKDNELAELAQDSRGMSCRDLKEVSDDRDAVMLRLLRRNAHSFVQICEHTERKWAARRVRKERVSELPVLDEYKRSLHDRLESADRHKASVRM
jgi:AAA+ superfamily predicted ATPase